MVAHAGQVTDSAAADRDGAVLLEVMVDAGYVRGDLFAVGQPDAGDLSQRRVGLLWRLGSDDEADTFFLRRAGDI